METDNNSVLPAQLDKVETYEEAKIVLKKIGEYAKDDYEQRRKKEEFGLAFLAGLGAFGMGIAASLGVDTSNLISASQYAIVGASPFIGKRLYSLIKAQKGIRLANKYIDFSQFEGMTEEELIKYANEDIEHHNLIHQNDNKVEEQTLRK